MRAQVSYKVAYFKIKNSFNLDRIALASVMKLQRRLHCIAARPRLLLTGMFAVLILVWASSSTRWSSTKAWMAVGGDSSQVMATATVPNDRLLGGLLLPDFNEESCLSRYQSMLYRKASPYILSSYLISKLRAYEELHKRCAPNTPLFRKSLEQLKSNHSTDQLECNYVLWSPFGGVGNRLLTLASTFLYALLTNRVMLIERVPDMSDMLCEPFPDSTWYIPPDFPIKNMEGYGINSQNSYGYMVAHNLIKDDPRAAPTELPPFIYVHLQYNYIYHDLHARFFCEGDQEVINKINWILLKSDNYIVPGLFTIPKYKQELDQMFPIKETVFHHLGRYLLHPSNSVWGMIRRYHNSYLAKVNERIGIQARIFKSAPISIDDMYKQIIACTQEESILPEINAKQPEGSAVLNETSSRSILVVSLYGEFYERLKDLYYTHSTNTGEIISVHQPSHEGEQKFQQQLHNQKALAEIWLLSFSDVLVTSAGSTFGYVSYSLAGIKPWFLLSSKDRKVPNPPCRRAATIDACFHSPPNFNCKTRSKGDTAKLVRHVRHCVDMEYGVMLFD